MIKINLICIGKLKEEYWRAACSEYMKRMRIFCKFSIIELPESRLPNRPSKAQIQTALNTEGEKMLKVVGNSPLIALCVEGSQISSEMLAEKLTDLGVRGCDTVSFLIGSSFGLGENVKKKSDLKLSLSRMTFPHQLARVILCEQIYRAFEIANHGKYQK